MNISLQELKVHRFYCFFFCLFLLIVNFFIENLSRAMAAKIKNEADKVQIEDDANVTLLENRMQKHAAFGNPK